MPLFTKPFEFAETERNFIPCLGHCSKAISFNEFNFCVILWFFMFFYCLAECLITPCRAPDEMRGVGMFKQ